MAMKSILQKRFKENVGEISGCDTMKPKFRVVRCYRRTTRCCTRVANRKAKISPKTPENHAADVMLGTSTPASKANGCGREMASERGQPSRKDVRHVIPAADVSRSTRIYSTYPYPPWVPIYSPLWRAHHSQNFRPSQPASQLKYDNNESPIFQFFILNFRK